MQRSCAFEWIPFQLGMDSYKRGRKEVCGERKHTKEGSGLSEGFLNLRSQFLSLPLCSPMTCFGEVKNKSAVSQPSTYSGFSAAATVVFWSHVRLETRSHELADSWSDVAELWAPCFFFHDVHIRVRVFQAQVAFLQGERKGQENMKQDLVRRIKMLEYALKQER